MNKFCLVPDSELEKLEKTRIRRVEHLAPEGCDTFKTSQAILLTTGMWHLANRKWEKVSFENKEIILNRRGSDLKLSELKLDVDAALSKNSDPDALMFTTETVKSLISKIEELQTQTFTRVK